MDDPPERALPGPTGPPDLTEPASSRRRQLFASSARLALWGIAALETLSEADRRVVADVWERLDDLFPELDAEDRRRLGLPAA